MAWEKEICQPAAGASQGRRRLLAMSTAAAPLVDDPERLATWRMRVFAATWLSYFGLYFCRKPYSIVKKDLGDANGWGADELGTIYACYLVAYAMGQFLAGAFGQRLGPRTIVLTGMAVSIVANAAFGFTNSAPLFMVFMFCNGLAQATGWSANVGTMATWYHRQERGRVMGVWATNFQAGGVAANALAAWALGAWGYQYAFFTGSVVLFVLWGFFIFNQRNRPEDVGLKPVEDPAPAEGQSAAPVADGAAWPRAVIINLALVSAFYFFLKSIRYAIWSWAPYLLQTHHKLSGADAGFASTAFDVAGIVGVIAIGFASDRLFAGRRAMVSFLFVLGLVGSCAMLYLAGPVSVTLFTISITLVGFTLYGPDALMSGAGAIDVGSRDRAVLAAGVINGAGSVGTVIQELVLGKLLAKDDLGSALALLFVSATAAAGCLGLILLRNRRGSADL